VTLNHARKHSLLAVLIAALAFAGCGTEVPGDPGSAAAPLAPCPTGTTTAKKLANLDCRVTRLENPSATASPTPTVTPTRDAESDGEPDPHPHGLTVPHRDADSHAEPDADAPSPPGPTPAARPPRRRLPQQGLAPTASPATPTPDFSSYSNGWNTYVTNQDFGVNGSQSLWANGPRNWKVVSTMADDGGRVQTFPNAQQLYEGNDADPEGHWPMSGFSAVKVNYNETSPGGANHYQFSPDVFFSVNPASPGYYPNDVMFWTDVNGRCNAGAYGPSLLGHFTMPDGSGWTAHRYDNSPTTTGNTGAEIILVKDGPGGQGTCAQESSGVIDIKAGIAWLSSHGFMPADPRLYILQTGWEITAAATRRSCSTT
jgi:hypothetical protein